MSADATDISTSIISPPRDMIDCEQLVTGVVTGAVADDGPGAYHSTIPADAGGFPHDAGAAAAVVVRLRGLPFNASESDVRAFAKGYLIDDPDGVLVMMHGDRRGEGFIRFTDAFEAQRFQSERDRQNMGERYIEVYMSYPGDMAAALAEEVASGSQTKNPIVRLRGLPFSATDDDVVLFFSQCSDRIVNVKFVEDIQGRRTGDAFLELADEDAVSIALTKHRLLMGTRYVEVARTTAADREAVLHVASRRGRGGAPAALSLQQEFQRNMFGGADGGLFPPFGMMHPMLNPFLFMPPLAAPLAGPDGLVTVQIGKEAAEQAAAAQAARASALSMMQASMLGMGHPDALLREGRGTRKHQARPQSGSPQPEQEVGAYSSSRSLGQEDSRSASAPPLIAPPSPLMPPTPPRPQSRFIIRVRGLPFSASEETVAEFFYDVNVQPQGVHMVYNAQDKPTGEAFVEVESEADVHRALEHNGGALGHRYIEVFKSGPSDMQRLGGGPHGGGAAPPIFPPDLMGAGGLLPPAMMPPFPMFPFGIPPTPHGFWGSYR